MSKYNGYHIMKMWYPFFIAHFDSKCVIEVGRGAIGEVKMWWVKTVL